MDTTRTDYTNTTEWRSSRNTPTHTHTQHTPKLPPIEGGTWRTSTPSEARFLRRYVSVMYGVHARRQKTHQMLHISSESADKSPGESLHESLKAHREEQSHARHSYNTSKYPTGRRLLPPPATCILASLIISSSCRNSAHARGGKEKEKEKGVTSN